MTTRVQKMQLEQSELREKINARFDDRDAGKELTTEQRAELDTWTKRSQECEIELRAAIVAEPKIETTVVDGLDPETRAFNELKSKVKLHRYIGAAIESRSVDGAEAEYCQALKLQTGQVPLEMFAPPEKRQIETRASTNTDIITTPRPWLDRLFADSAAMALGLTMESVAPGVASHPVTTGGGTPAQRGREEAATAGAWTIGVVDLKPTRMTIHYEFAIEDAARLPGLEMALTRDMGMAISEQMDRAIFTGDDGANENTADIPAISATAGITAKTITQADKVKYDKNLEIFVDLLDGVHAESLNDLMVVAYVGANKLWCSTVANATAENDTIKQFLNNNGLTWRTRGNVELNTANADEAAMIGLGRGIEGAGVVATWEGAQLIRDHYSGAKSGQVQLSLHVLWNYAIVRAANFAKLTFVT